MSSVSSMVSNKLFLLCLKALSLPPVTLRPTSVFEIVSLPAVCAGNMDILAFTRPKAGREVGPLNWMDSRAQKRLRRSRIEGYGPRPQARARLARAAVVPPASAQASSRTRTAGHCASVRRPWGLSRSRQFCTVFRIFTH